MPVHPLQGKSKPGAGIPIQSADHMIEVDVTSLDEYMVADCRAYPYPRPGRHAI
jgi:hypothetical protein